MNTRDQNPRNTFDTAGETDRFDIVEETNKDEVLVPYCRAAAEREILMDLMAMRDESYLCRLDPKDREMITNEAIGVIMQLDAQQIVAQAAAVRPTGSFSEGVGCQGTPGFTNGITCKLIFRRRGG